MSSERHTGLNSYLMRTAGGYYLKCPIAKSTCIDKDDAHMWMIEPEKLDARLAEIRREHAWAAVIMAVRAR